MDYQLIDLARLNRADAYKLFLTVIVPRPIGWVSTCSLAGVANVAPFSWFNAVCGDPLMVMIAVGKRHGGMKDTSANIRDTAEFVANVATEASAAQMVQSSADYPPEVSEFDAVGLTPLPSTVVRPPRVGESPIHLECKLEQIIPLGNQSTDLIIGRCEVLHVAREVLAEDGYVDVAKLRPIARLGRDEYAVVTDYIRFPRPRT